MSEITHLKSMNFGNGFRAYSLRGGTMAEPIDPFLGVDHAWMSEPTFPAHPHAGFSAVSYVFLDSETGIKNRDTLGNRNLIHPGGLHWTTAGRGVVHEEVPDVTGKTVHMLQIFVNLAIDLQGTEPFVLSIEPQDVPTLYLPGAEIRVPLGSYGNVRSHLRPPTEVSLIDISVDDGADISVPIPAGHCNFFMPISGEVEIDEQSFDANEMKLPVFSELTTSRDVKLSAKKGPAKVIVFSGSPLRQPLHWHGSLAMASVDVLNARLAAYKRGEFGFIQ